MKEIKKVILVVFLFGFFQLVSKPRVSIITSVYNGDAFIEEFLADITKQTMFNECELLVINANSPGNEEPIIINYMQKYSNIFYLKLKSDPGLYAVWNIGIMLARGDFITNANLDDRRNHECLEIQARALEENPEIDLVYGDYLVTYQPNQTFVQNTYRYCVSAGDFDPRKMFKCLPGPMPMWRKSMHEKYGFFDELFLYCGDFDMWNRAVSMGAQFKRIDFIAGLFYQNPNGLSTNQDPEKVQKRNYENEIIVKRYAHVWVN